MEAWVNFRFLRYTIAMMVTSVCCLRRPVFVGGPVNWMVISQQMSGHITSDFYDEISGDSLAAGSKLTLPTSNSHATANHGGFSLTMSFLQGATGSGAFRSSRAGGHQTRWADARHAAAGAACTVVALAQGASGAFVALAKGAARTFVALAEGHTLGHNKDSEEKLCATTGLTLPNLKKIPTWDNQCQWITLYAPFACAAYDQIATGPCCELHHSVNWQRPTIT